MSKRTVSHKHKHNKFKMNVWLFIAIFFTSFFVFLFFILKTDRVLQNTYFGPIDLSGIKSEEAVILTQDKLSNFEDSELTLNLGDRTFDVKVTDLGINYDQSANEKQIVESDRKPNIFSKKELVPIYNVDLFKLQSFIEQNLSQYETPASNSPLILKDDVWTIQAQSQGKNINSTKLISDLKDRAVTLSVAPISLDIVEETHETNAINDEAVNQRLNTLQNIQITLNWNEQSWHLSNDELISNIRFVKKGYDLDGFLYNFSLPVKVSLNPIVDEQSSELMLANSYLDKVVVPIKRAIDVPSVNATLKFENGRVSEFTPAHDGLELDAQKTKEEISATALGDISTKIVNIGLPVKVTTAKIDNQEINALGIKELIGKGVSYFSGSIPNRIFNVGLGASRVTGALIKPGEVFSFNKTVGEISGATGYKQAYVISAGRTVLDDGGGICQVSTTVFRAALNSGLPIVTRTAHAYRVGYYEQHGFKPGIDATVWSPSVDLQFKNDTNNSILLQAVVDPNLLRLEVDLYGTSDGRKVETTDPVVSNQTPALPDKFQDDPTLEKGTTKQVDFSAAGATATFKRKVTRGNDVLIDETFRSVYRPWQAIFLVGTKS